MSRTDVRTVDDRILEAARSCVLEYGVRKTTLVEVARRANVSRPTVYRRWPDTDTLIAELMTREFRLAVADAWTNGTDSRALIVRSVVEGSRRLRNHELFVKIFNADADLMLTYIVGRLGRSQREVIVTCSTAIRAGQDDGTVRDGDAEQMATMVLLIVQSAVQSSRMVEDTLPPDVLDEQLARAIDGFLAPGGRT